MTRFLFAIGAIAFLTTTVVVAQDPPPATARPAQPPAKGRPDNPFGVPPAVTARLTASRLAALAALEEELSCLEPSATCAGPISEPLRLGFDQP